MPARSSVNRSPSRNIGWSSTSTTRVIAPLRPGSGSGHGTGSRAGERQVASTTVPRSRAPRGSRRAPRPALAWPACRPPPVRRRCRARRRAPQSQRPVVRDDRELRSFALTPVCRTTLRAASTAMRYAATSTAAGRSGKGSARVRGRGTPASSAASDHGTDETQLVQRGRAQPAADRPYVVQRVPRGRLQPGQSLGRLPSGRCAASPAARRAAWPARRAWDRARRAARGATGTVRSSRAVTSSCRFVSRASASWTACTARPPWSASSARASRSCWRTPPSARRARRSSSRAADRRRPAAAACSSPEPTHPWTTRMPRPPPPRAPPAAMRRSPGPSRRSPLRRGWPRPPRSRPAGGRRHPAPCLAVHRPVEQPLQQPAQWEQGQGDRRR